MKKTLISAAAFAAVLLSSCGTASKSVDISGEWNVVSVEGKEVTGNPYIGFDMENGRLYGNAGCNRIMGGVEIDSVNPGHIGLTNIGATRMMCPDMETEQKVLEALNEVAGYKASATGVELTDKDGKVLMSLEKREAPAVSINDINGEWTISKVDGVEIDAGQAVYGILCYENGCAVDDLIAYIQSDSKILLVVNAANDDKDFAYIQSLCPPGIELEHASARLGQLALQGPKAQEALSQLTSAPLASLKSFHFLDGEAVAGIPCCISRTGYTGEDGFEIYGSAEYINKVWDILVGSKEVAPCGLGCRDTLRFEVALPLYGHELSQDITPIEAGLGSFVKMDKPEFIGKEAIAQQKEHGIVQKVVGIELHEKAVPRSGYDIEVDGVRIGYVTTGYQSISTGKSVCMALIDNQYAALGTEVDVRIRKKTFKGTVCKKRFYQKNYKK